MFKLLSILFLMLLFLPSVLFSQEAVVIPTPGVGLETFIAEVIALIALIKGGAVGGLVIASSVLALILQVIKLKILQPIMEKNRMLVFAITTTIGVAITMVTSLVAGMDIASAAIAAVFTGGGAVAIYGAWRAFFKKD